MPFTFAKCPIEGLWEVQPKVFGDKRGYFFEVYSEKDFHEAGLTMHFVQDNQSASFKGVLRGLHFQKKHPQGKLVRAVQGLVYDVAVDLRNGSPTFGSYYGVDLDSEKQNQFYIPEGFAHGFLSDKELRLLYPELRHRLMETPTTIINRLLLWMTCHH
ncbi:MAG: dTDP-4-dehydrorhamnose 3,5-epimerase, partial [Treponema sp.]|nr:dTDP-4-dehydrorhamnose 3,5-epimerase [Treponema sp.]